MVPQHASMQACALPARNDRYAVNIKVHAESIVNA